MNINLNNGFAAYSSYRKLTPSAPVPAQNNASQTASPTASFAGNASAAESADTVTLSAHAQSAESAQPASEKDASAPGYDLAEVLRIHKKSATEVPTGEESDYYWSARKNDPELDAMLYAQDKADALAFVGKIQAILLKASLGQRLTAEEEKLVKDDPMLQQEISMRKSKAQLVE